jgi:hypothetical protein
MMPLIRESRTPKWTRSSFNGSNQFLSKSPFMLSSSAARISGARKYQGVMTLAANCWAILLHEKYSVWARMLRFRSSSR